MNNYTKIYQNSYVVAIITFVVLCALFYLLEIGWVNRVVDGKIVKKFSWVYPLAIALVVWIVWHFYLYPPPAPIVAKSAPLQAQIDAAKIKGWQQPIYMHNWN